MTLTCDIHLKNRMHNLSVAAKKIKISTFCVTLKVFIFEIFQGPTTFFAYPQNMHVHV